MYLAQIKLINFKNFEQQIFEFSPKINCLLGNNGVGKTNVLDAIYYLSFCKSYFHHTDSHNIKFDQDYFVLEGLYHKNEREELIFCNLKKDQKKILKRNGKVYEKLSHHIGHFPLVIISPYDRDLILDGSDVRRKFLDSVITQTSPSYLQHLIRYNKVLVQRNALLKYFFVNNTFNANTIAIYDDELIRLGFLIFEQRKTIITEFSVEFQRFYTIITQNKEQVSINYVSDLECDDAQEIFNKSLERDRASQYTTKGIHKDDLELLLFDRPIKKIGSQGQQKSFLIALKLAQLTFIKQQLGITPILLLDDIFDKLDETRVAQLIKMVNEENFGQIFISDTHAERTERIVKEINEEHVIFKL